MKPILLLLLTLVPIFAITTEERAFIAKERAALRKSAIIFPQIDGNGDEIIPAEIFHRELEIILSSYNGQQPYTHSVMGERFRSLRHEELRTGLTPTLRAKWEDAYWTWRAILDGGR